MQVKTTAVLKLLYILSWIIFVGLGIEAGGFLTNTFFAIFRPAAVKNLWHEVDLSALLAANRSFFITLTGIMSVIALVKAWLFYGIIRLLHDKSLDMAKPFTDSVQKFLILVTYQCFLIGLFCYWGVHYYASLAAQGIPLPATDALHFSGADVWLFMAVVLFVVAQIFRKGIALQTENELTI